MIFFINIITLVISSIQIACDVMCIEHVIQHKLKKKLILYYIIFETNIFIEMLSAWLFTVKVIGDNERPKFL